MADRFERLFSLPSNLYSAGSPVIVVAGALLKDNLSGNVIVQLKFQNVTPLLIKAVKVNVAAFDATGEEIESVHNYQYLDLKIQSGATFGSKKAIVMPNAATRCFELRRIQVVLENGEVCDVAMPLSALPQVTVLHSALGNTELVKQYRITINQYAEYVPKDVKTLWQCSCGTWNGQEICSSCGADKAIVFSAFDTTDLSQKAKVRLEKEKIEQHAKAEQEKLAAEEEAKRIAALTDRKIATLKKIKIVVAIIAPIIILTLLFAFWLYPDVIQPYSKYEAAQLLLSNENYDDAIIIFTELEGYKDSSDMVNESLYQKGNSLLGSQNYDDAIIVFESLGEYKDSSNRIKEVNYQKAWHLAEMGNLKDAIIILTSLDGYAASDSDLDMLNYQYATELLETGNYDEAKVILQSINDYKDSAILITECDYLKASEYYQKEKYAEASTLFKSLEQYKDSANMVVVCTYRNAVSMMHQKNYAKAIAQFMEIRNYEDADELINECMYLQAKQHITAGNYNAANDLFGKLQGYKDSSDYLTLLSDTVSIVFSTEPKYIHSSNYIWIVTEIDTSNCTSRLIVYEGRESNKEYVLEYVPNDSMKFWKMEGSKMLITSDGIDPFQTHLRYWVWSISGDWNAIYEQTHINGHIHGKPGEYDVHWKRVDSDTAKIIKQAFISYFERSNDWAAKDWVAAKGTFAWKDQ